MKKKTYYVNDDFLGLQKDGKQRKVMVSDFYEDGDTSVFLKENCSLLPTSDPGIKIVDLKDIVFFGG